MDYSIVNALDPDTMVATNIDGSTISSALFDIATYTRQDVAPVSTTSVVNPESWPIDQCDVVEGLLVCFVDRGVMPGVIIDPLTGSTTPMPLLGNHANTLDASGLPWMAHAWNLLSARRASWEDMPSYGDITGFGNAVWTGQEIVFFAGSNASELPGTAAAYTPLHPPGP